MAMGSDQIIDGVNNFRLLVDKADIDPVITSRDGSNILHDAASSYNLCLMNSLRPDFLTTLSSYCPDFNAKTVLGHTPLMKLIQEDRRWNEKAFAWLISNGADVNVPMSVSVENELQSGLTCLHLAISSPQHIGSLSEHDERFVSPSESYAIVNTSAWVMNDLCYGSVHDVQDDNQRREGQRQMIKSMIRVGADIYAVSKHWGTPADVARTSGNFDFWCDILQECNEDVSSVLMKDSEIIRKPETSELLNKIQRTNHNRKIVEEKVRQFWSSLERWTVQPDAHPPTFVPLLLGTRPRSLRGSRYKYDLRHNTSYRYRYFLLRLLSGKHIRKDSLIDECSLFDAELEFSCLVDEVLWYIRRSCRSKDDLDILELCCFPRVRLAARTAASFDFIRVCQATATGVWTAEQEAARQSDWTRLRLAERPMLRFLQILVRGLVKMAWQDEIMGWDDFEDPHKTGKVPGQWVED